MSNSEMSDANELFHTMAREVWLTARDWEPKSDSPTGISRYVKANDRGYAVGIAYVNGAFRAYVAVDGDKMYVMSDGNNVIATVDITQALSCDTVHHARSILDDIIKHVVSNEF